MREQRELGARRWGITLTGDDTVVGLLGYNYWDVQHRRAAIGYDLKRSLWGKGLAAEAMELALGFGFDRMDLNRVEAHTDAANARSIRLLRRLGFWQEGTFHERYLEDGAFHDVALFVLLRRDRVRHLAPDRGREQGGNTPVTRRSYARRPWTASRSSCSAPSRNATSASCASGSPMSSAI
ncbi:hypothetical protein BJF78_08675 [Pseudonocardia sp. CNS-139]|nr:hypothetical protein BJF78_08675 [Pseudonocardia sp. CNS-139]